jgi:hypothetical protein
VQQDLDRATPDVADAAALHRSHPHVADVLASRGTLNVRAANCTRPRMQASAQLTSRIAAALGGTTAVDSVRVHLLILTSVESAMLEALRDLATSMRAAPRAPRLALNLMCSHDPSVTGCLSFQWNVAKHTAAARLMLEQLEGVLSCTLWRLSAGGAVAAALPALHTLRQLMLDRHLSAENMQQLAAELPCMPQLSQLRLICTDAANAQVAAALAASVAQLGGLQNLALLAPVCTRPAGRPDNQSKQQLADAFEPHILSLTALSLQQLPFRVRRAPTAARAPSFARMQTLQL